MARRKTLTVPVVLPEGESVRAGWLRGFRLSGFALTVLFLIVAALVSLAPSLKNLVEQQQQIADLEASVALAEQQRDDLQQQVDRWKDPVYLKAQARDRLSFAFPGDITYLLTGVQPEAVPTPGGLPITDELQESETDWMTALLASTIAAGLSPEAPDELVAPELGGVQR